MKKLSLILLFLFLGFSGEVLASSAKSVVETQVEGEGEVYQYVETTVDGETVRKESTEPGKLELEMEKVGESEPTVTFSQETISPSYSLTPTPNLKAEKSPVSFIVSITEFCRKLFSRLARLVGLDKLVKISYL